MMSSAQLTNRRPIGARRRVTRYVGRAVYIYAFDAAYEMTRQPIRKLLGQPVEQFTVDSSKRNPHQPFFYRPQMVRLPAMDRIGPHGRTTIERTVKLLPVGAISITVSVPFIVGSIDEIVAYHDLEFNNGSLHEEVRRELSAYWVRPVPHLMEEEAYTVFCLDAPLKADDGAPLSAEDWLEDHRREVAALLTAETDVDQLSRQEANESTGVSAITKMIWP